MVVSDFVKLIMQYFYPVVQNKTTVTYLTVPILLSAYQYTCPCKSCI